MPSPKSFDAEADRKRKIRPARRREAKHLVRDWVIYRKLRFKRSHIESRLRLFSRPNDPLLVYLDDPTGHFPARRQPNGQPIPQWDDRSKWLKVQVAVRLLNNCNLLTFNVNLHPDLESRMAANGQDVRKVLLASIGRELKRATGVANREFYFVVEGWSKTTKEPTGLHVHGAARTLNAALAEPMLDVEIRED